MAEGIEVRHKGRCRSHDGGRCTCDPTYRASVYSRREQRSLRRSFPTMAAAKAWRADASSAIRAGRMRATPADTLDVMIEKWLDGAERGIIRTRGRRPFKDSTVRAVRQHYVRRIQKRFGPRRLDAIEHLDLQEFIDELEMSGLAASTIEGTMLPLRLLYRWARARGHVATDPTEGLEFPQKIRGTRKPPSPADAAALLAGLPEDQQALWATAMFAGLRRGELFGLDWEDVDLDGGTLEVKRSFDPATLQMVAPKSRQGIRRVPIGGSLTPYLRRHALRTGRRTGLVFGRTATRPPRPDSAQGAADAAWSAAGLERVTLHACRHLYASMSIAAGVNAHALCKYMGHSGIQVTYDLYGHLFPGNEAEASALLDAYIDGSFRVRG